MTQDTIKQRLSAARALIEQPEHWIQGAFQRYSDGKCVDRIPYREVMARCADGALMEVCGADEYQKVKRYLVDSINRYLGSDYVLLITWHDRPRRTHAQVMQAFDHAYRGDD